MRDDLRRHPPVRPRLGRHHPPAGVEQPRDAEVCDLDAARIVEEEVRGLQVAVHDAALVEVVHAAGDLGSHLEEGQEGGGTAGAHPVEDGAAWFRVELFF